jgi:hypothetical protein
MIRDQLVRARWQSLGYLCVLICIASGVVQAQDAAPEKPLPILTGSAGFFTNGNDGHTEIAPVVSPVLLLPLGDKFLVEARGEFEGEFARKTDGSYGGSVNKELNYAQLDYIANPYVTFTAGRFLTPFGIYNERLYPVWIRDLQSTPLIFPIGTGSSDGVMLRGGFPINANVNLNYATYFSASSSIDALESDRLVGTRVGVFLPAPRIEVGASFQKLLQEDRRKAVGFHFAWQPQRVPLNLRSEYAWSETTGSGYWIEAAHRLSQVSRWQRFMRHTEVVGRMQQFFAGNIQPADASQYGLPDVDARQADFGMNYYFQDGLKAAASYGHQFSSDGNFNVWSIGVAYRFVLPLGRVTP